MLLVCLLSSLASCVPNYSLVGHRPSGLSYACVSPDGNYSMILKGSQTL